MCGWCFCPPPYLQDIENKILQMLANASGNILDDEELIETLGGSPLPLPLPLLLLPVVVLLVVLLVVVLLHLLLPHYQEPLSLSLVARRLLPEQLTRGTPPLLLVTWPQLSRR